MKMEDFGVLYIYVLLIMVVTTVQLKLLFIKILGLKIKITPMSLLGAKVDHFWFRPK